MTTIGRPDDFLADQNHLNGSDGRVRQGNTTTTRTSTGPRQRSAEVTERPDFFLGGCEVTRPTGPRRKLRASWIQTGNDNGNHEQEEQRQPAPVEKPTKIWSPPTKPKAKVHENVATIQEETKVTTHTKVPPEQHEETESTTQSDWWEEKKDNEEEHNKEEKSCPESVATTVNQVLQEKIAEKVRTQEKVIPPATKASNNEHEGKIAAQAKEIATQATEIAQLQKEKEALKAALKLAQEKARNLEDKLHQIQKIVQA